MKIIKGDKIKVLIGKDKGRIGEVIQCQPKKSLVTIKGLNIFKKHIKGTEGRAGSILEKERPLKSSKVILICPQCQKATRVGYQIDKSGKKYRICKKCKSIIDKIIAKK